jgi:thioredoxin reductase (NADPH)
MRDLIIIGGGAAGLSAAVFAQEKQLNYLLVAPAPGGKAASSPWGNSAGAAVVHLFADRLDDTPDHTLADCAVKISRADVGFEVQTERNGTQEALSVLVATGVKPVLLPVSDGGSTLRYDLGYSATTHAQRMAGKHVAVIGSTVRSLRGVHELSTVARRVYFVVDTVAALATPLGIAVQYRPNVEVLESYHVTGVEQAAGSAVVQLARGSITRNLAVDAIFADLGLRPDSALVRPLLQTDLSGFIPVDETGATSQPGLYAAGDVTTAFAEQVLVAVGQGARAAQSAYEYVLARPSLRQAS